MKTRLTDQALRSCKPDPSRKPIWDSVVTGLHFRPHTKEKGQGQFYVKYRAGGKQRRSKIGAYPDVKLAEARVEADEILRRVRKGEDPGADRPRPTRSMRPEVGDEITFATAVDDFIEKFCKPTQKTWYETERMLKARAVPELGDRRLADITQQDIIALLSKVQADIAKSDDPRAGDGATTASRLYAYLSRFFRWAVFHTSLDSSPIVRGLKQEMGYKERVRTRRLTEDELRKIRDATNALGVPFGPFYKFLILTGQRLREVAGMRWDELHSLDGKEPIWIIPAERYKTGEEQRMPLSRAAVDVLLTEVRRYADEDHRHVFVSGIKGDSPIKGFGRAKRRIDKLAKVEDWRNHDLRRTMRTFMELDRDIGPAIAERCLGHTIQGIEKHYVASLPEDHMRDAFQAWADHVLSLKDPDDGARKPVERDADNVVELRKRVA